MILPHPSVRHPLSALPGRRRRRGISLVGALVACAVVALSLAAAMRAQSSLRAGADSARQRTEATRLAQAEVERLRAFGRLAGSSGYEAIASGSNGLPADGGSTAYTLARRVAEQSPPDYKSVQVEVSWPDRRGAVERVRLATLIGRRDPGLGGALMQPAHGRAAARVLGRDVRVPIAARDLGDGRSLLRLGDAATQAVLIDNATAAVIAACRIAAGAGSAAGPADASDCSPVRGLLVTGRVRFSLGATPSALAPDDAPLAFDLAFAQAPAGPAAPACGTSVHASAGGERWVDYVCLVTLPAGAAGWSGRNSLAPDGWLVGTTAGRYRVCRYSADHDASGSIDRDSEHPADYRAVSGPLAEQNFLVIAGPQTCPGGDADNRADLHSTVQHQP